MNSVAKAIDSVRANETPVKPQYLEALHLVERLHRRLLDVIKDEFERRGRDDVNSVQALLLYNIGDKELTASELRTRGYYLGSNAAVRQERWSARGRRRGAGAPMPIRRIRDDSGSGPSRSARGGRASG